MISFNKQIAQYLAEVNEKNKIKSKFFNFYEKSMKIKSSIKWFSNRCFEREVELREYWKVEQ